MYDLLLFLSSLLKFKELSFEFEKKIIDKIKKIIKTLLYPMISVIRKTCYKRKSFAPLDFTIVGVYWIMCSSTKRNGRTVFELSLFSLFTLQRSSLLGLFTHLPLPNLVRTVVCWLKGAGQLPHVLSPRHFSPHGEYLQRMPLGNKDSKGINK